MNVITDYIRLNLAISITDYMKKLCTVLGLIAVTALLTATSVSIADASVKPPDFKNKGQCIATSGSDAAINLSQYAIEEIYA
jgi:hypothetical protein